MNTLIFDIETVPDVAHARRLYQLDDLSDTDAAEALFAMRRAKTGHEFLPHHLQRVVAISLVLSSPNQLKVWSLGDENQADERDLIYRFFKGLEKIKPVLVSWNGSGFDLPVLHYRALLHGVEAATYWEIGENESAFRWNNYLNRFHYRHLDLMDVLAGYQNKAFAPLDEIACMLGLPGKMGMSGSKVWEAFQAGELQAIRHYCETDVLNTYGVFLHFERMRGVLTTDAYLHEIKRLRDYLAGEADKPHLHDFLQQMTCGAG